MASLNFSSYPRKSSISLQRRPGLLHMKILSIGIALRRMQPFSEFFKIDCIAKPHYMTRGLMLFFLSSWIGFDQSSPYEPAPSHTDNILAQVYALSILGSWSLRINNVFGLFIYNFKKFFSNELCCLKCFKIHNVTVRVFFFSPVFHKDHLSLSYCYVFVKFHGLLLCFKIFKKNYNLLRHCTFIIRALGIPKLRRPTFCTLSPNFLWWLI